LLEELGFPVVRSKHSFGGEVRFVLFPKVGREKATLTKEWVQNGCLLILGDDSHTFAEQLGIDLDVYKSEEDPGAETVSGAVAARIALGKVEVESDGKDGKVWVRGERKPFVTIYPLGKGEVWLLNYPRFLSNEVLGRVDNCILLCRLAEEALRRRPGTIYFDEYFHGMRDRPGVGMLLLQPPTVWITVQGVLLAGLLLWHYVPRFGTLRVVPPSRRRSREEFLDAMATLLERKADYAEAYRTAREDLIREMERDLGLPAGTEPEQLLLEATRRRPIGQEPLRRLLGLKKGLGVFSIAPSSDTQRNRKDSRPLFRKSEFINALNELEKLRDDFFAKRHHR
jgi:hypothetical protein